MAKEAKETLKVDILTELTKRGCIHIIDKIFENLGPAGFAAAAQVSSRWKDIVEAKVLRLSKSHQDCYCLFSQLVYQNAPSWVDWKAQSYNYTGSLRSQVKGFQMCCKLAAEIGDLDLLRERSYYLHSFGDNGLEPLVIRAINGGHVEVVEFLMVWSCFNHATTINSFSERILIQPLNEQKEKILKVLRDRQGDVWMEKCLRSLSLTYKSDLYDRLTGPAIERAQILIKEIREKEERRQRQPEYEFDLWYSDGQGPR